MFDWQQKPGNPESKMLSHELSSSSSALRRAFVYVLDEPRYAVTGLLDTHQHVTPNLFAVVMPRLLYLILAQVRAEAVRLKKLARHSPLSSQPTLSKSPRTNQGQTGRPTYKSKEQLSLQHPFGGVCCSLDDVGEHWVTRVTYKRAAILNPCP